MANMVTKTINTLKVNALVFNLETMSTETKSQTFGKEPSERQLEKAFSTETAKFIKIESTEKIEDYRKMPTATFMQFAHKLTAGESRVNLVTRTISKYKSIVLCYNLETDSTVEVTFDCEVTEIKKCDLVGKVALKVLNVTKTEELYAMDIDTFIKYSEPVEK